MLLNIQEVFSRKEEIISHMNSLQERDPAKRVLNYFNDVQVDGVIVFPDDILMRFLEINYLFDTQFLPNKLPAGGMSVANVLEHEGSSYITLSRDVMLSNNYAFFLFREHEELYRAWLLEKEELEARLSRFTESLQLVAQDSFGLKVFVSGDGMDSSVGFDFMSAPKSTLIESLGLIPAMVGKNLGGGHEDLVDEALDLWRALKPYSSLHESMRKVRRDSHHKGIPGISDGMLRLTAPAASGGSVFHTVGPSDDVMRALPSESLLMMMGAQSGRTGVSHIGAGSLEGVHYTFIVPEESFFPKVQALVEEDDTLKGFLDDLDDTGASVVESLRKATNSHKKEVVRDVVPGIVGGHVLGFHIDMISHPTTAYINPIISQSACDKNLDFLVENGILITNTKFDDVMIETQKGYGRWSSVFDMEEVEDSE